MTTATFLLSKDPDTTHGGDLTLSRLLMKLAAESLQVDVLCLSEDPSTASPAVRKVLKPEVSLRSIALRSIRTGRSLVHARFDVDEFVAAIDELDSDLFVADHSYMAEPYLRSGQSPTKLVVNTVISESLVWGSTRGIVGRLDKPRIRRDELRVARAARTVGTYDEDEARDYRGRGVRNVHWLDVTLPPAAPVDVASTGPRLLFLGDRTWPPNQEGFELLMQWWPAIAAGIPGAELFVVGKRSGALRTDLPDGVHDVGFADDLDALVSSCRGLVAPILTGGGVRVKILDSASRGLPVVGTTPAVGSLAPVFGLQTLDDKDGFVAAARRLLLDRAAAAAEGRRLHDANAQRWELRTPHSIVENWLLS